MEKKSLLLKETDDEDDYDTKWSKLDDSVDQHIPAHFDETNIKKDDSLYDDIIEEDPHNYDEEPFDPSVSAFVKKIYK